MRKLIAYSAGRFQHAAARRRLEYQSRRRWPYRRFQHAAARRQLVPVYPPVWKPSSVSTRSRPKAAVGKDAQEMLITRVSTRSRPKAAGGNGSGNGQSGGFNTQPPEGGWQQAQPEPAEPPVSTRSRPKAAAQALRKLGKHRRFNTQPPEGGWLKNQRGIRYV